MAQRVRLAKTLAAAASSVSVRIRTAKPPFYVQANGGFTGSVTLEHSMDGPAVSDSAATWRALGTISNNDAIVVTHPLYRIRVDGDHSAGTATVDLLEYRGATT